MTVIETDTNHFLWLETVPAEQRAVVPEVVALWNSAADQFNQWSELGWDERDALL